MDVVDTRMLDKQRVSEALHQAQNELLFAVTAQALAAESGTEGFGFENIVGVGLSERVSAGRPIGEPGISVYVVRKAPPDHVEPQALVPKDYEGIATDVIESGEFAAFTERGRHRPAPPGVSIGHGATNDAGTLGFLAKRNGDLFIVSNNHVLARENQATQGDAILQPGVLDGGGKGDEVAVLDSWVSLDFANSPNRVDAAMATIDDGLASDRPYNGGPLILTPTQAVLNASVRKCGRTTGLTRGLITDVSAAIKVGYGTGTALLTDQVLIKGVGAIPFSERGDSGSLVVDGSSDQPVALVCGGSVRFTVANRIDEVLNGLGVSFGP